MHRHCFCRSRALIALAVFAAAPQAAQASSFCDFLTEVMAEKDTAFAKWRGEELNVGKSDETVYAGTLKPLPSAECRTDSEDLEGRPFYTCVVQKDLPSAEAGRPLFRDLAQQLEACYPAATFEEAAGPDLPENLSAHFGGPVDGYEMALFIAVDAAWYTEKRVAEILGLDKEMPPPTYAVEVDIRALSPGGH